MTKPISTKLRAVVYEAIRSAAERETFHPTGDELSAMTGACASHCNSAVLDLEKSGLIKIDRNGGKYTASILVVATGKTTRNATEKFTGRRFSSAIQCDAPADGDARFQAMLAAAGGFEDHPRAKPRRVAYFVPHNYSAAMTLGGVSM